MAQASTNKDSRVICDDITLDLTFATYWHTVHKKFLPGTH